MRKLAVVLPLVTGCATAPAENAVDDLQRAPMAERVNEEVVLGPDDVVGTGPGGGVQPVTETEPGGGGASEYAGDTGGMCEEGDGETCAASPFDRFGGWFGACLSGAYVACDIVITVCVQGRAASVGPLAIPCGAAIVGACAGTVACVVKAAVSQ